MSSVECREAASELRASRRGRADSRHPSPVTRRFREAFTLIELLTVIAIIGVLAALLTPVLKNFSKPEVNVAATRQMLDDMARARQLAISQRSTVFVVFVPTNFFAPSSTPWVDLPTAFKQSTIMTQMYDAQWNGYLMVSMRSVGDQPGRTHPKDLMPVKTLPQGAFIAPYKFLGGPYPIKPEYPANRPDLPIYAFPETNGIPFPTADVLSNTTYFGQFKAGNGFKLPYVAFNYLGQLTPGDGSVMAYDENIPLDYGSIVEPRDPNSHRPVPDKISVNELPPGNSTNTAYNVIHIDRLTGRARLERMDLL